MAFAGREGEERTSSRDMLNRIRALETLAQDLQRRVQDLEATSGQPVVAEEQPGPQSNRERNREIEEGAPGGGDPMAPRRDVLGAPHSRR